MKGSSIGIAGLERHQAKTADTNTVNQLIS